MSGPLEPGHADVRLALQDAQDRILTRLLYFSSVFGSLVTIQVWRVTPTSSLQWGRPGLLATLLLVYMSLARWHSYRVRAFATVVALLVYSWVGLRIAGFLGGPALACVQVCIFAALLFGSRGFVLTFAAVLAMLGLHGMAASEGTLTIPDIWYKPSESEAWLRFTMLASYIICLTGLSVIFLIDQLKRALDSRNALLGALEVQHQATLAAERERKSAELELSRAQRFQSLGRLAAGVAHDHNNTLMVVLQNAELLQTSFAEDPARVREVAEDIEKAAAAAASRSQQLLAVGGRSTLRPTRVDLGDLCRRMERMLAGVMGREIEIHFDIQANLPAAWIDAGRLQDAFLNLCLNAREAMPGGGTLRVLVMREPDDRFPHCPADPDMVYMIVADSGLGMSAETAGRIFEPYFTTREGEGGTGLGLAMVKGLMVQSGGRVDIWSESGIGTSFQLALPCAPDATGSDTPDHAQPMEGSESGATLGP